MTLHKIARASLVIGTITGVLMIVFTLGYGTGRYSYSQEILKKKIAAEQKQKPDTKKAPVKKSNHAQKKGNK